MKSRCFVPSLVVAWMLIPDLHSRAQEHRPEGHAEISTNVDSRDLAKGLAEVSCDKNTWDYFARFSSAMQFGMSEENLRDRWPGADFDALPQVVLAALREPNESANAWLECLKESSDSGVKEYPRDPDPLKVRNLASSVLQAIMPARGQAVTPGTAAERTGALTWTREAKQLEPSQRMNLWFQSASRTERTEFMLLACEAEHEPAFSIVEEQLLQDGKDHGHDEYLLAVVQAYFRQRRHNARKFFKNFEKQIQHDRKPGVQHVLRVGARLTQVRLGELSKQASNDEALAGLLEFMQLCVVRPRRSYRMGIQIEPMGMHLRSLRDSTKLCVSLAAGTKDLDMRMKFLSAAGALAFSLDESRRNSRSVYGAQELSADSPVHADLVAELKVLLEDKRTVDDGIRQISPSQMVSDVVRHFWLPRSWDDWRAELLYSLEVSQQQIPPGITYGLSQDILSGTRLSAEAFPAEKARFVVARLTDGDAALWRKLIAEMDWQEQLMLLKEGKTNEAFAHRLGSRSTEWVEWRKPDELDLDLKSFEEVWERVRLEKRLSDASISLIRNWLVSEHEAGRFWSIEGTSRANSPGITITISPGQEVVRMLSREKDFASDFQYQEDIYINGTREMIMDSRRQATIADGVMKFHQKEELAVPVESNAVRVIVRISTNRKSDVTIVD